MQFAFKQIMSKWLEKKQICLSRTLKYDKKKTHTIIQ